jgi:hypothetical protein
VIEPVGCLGCDRLYAYDATDGRRWVGCLERVFEAEIDLKSLEEASATEGRFGALRCSRPPLAVCRAAVEQAYPLRRPLIGCVRPEFAERAGSVPFVVSVKPSPPDGN